MCDCASQYDPRIDPPETLYGFSFAEWDAAGRRSGGLAALLVASWPSIMASVQTGGLVGLDISAFVALARLGPEYAERVIARLEPGFSLDNRELSAALSANGINPEYLARLHPGLAELQGVELANLIRDLRVERDLADEILALAGRGRSRE